MKISVALAVYNGERFIAQQLDSLMNQTRKPDEVIICDDKSSDSSYSLIDDYIQKNGLLSWKLFKNDSNLGYIANFRKILSMCTGDCVLLCDQDDVWLGSKIETLATLMEHNPQILALAGNCTFIDEHGNEDCGTLRPFYRKSLRWKPDSLHKTKEKLLYGNTAQGCTCIYRRSIVEQYLKVHDNCTLPHDWALNLLAHEQGGLYYLNSRLINYRVHSDNAVGAVSQLASCDNRAAIIKDYSIKLHEINKIQCCPEHTRGYRRLEDFSRLRETMVSEKKPLLAFTAMAKYPEFAFGYFFTSLIKDIIKAL